MRKILQLLIAVGIVLSTPIGSAQQREGDALEVYFIDVEGGQATLFVSPLGETLLVDTGFAGERDANRIASVAKQAGISEIDYLLVTHYHGDHVGGAPTLASLIPIRTFVDHGPNVEQPTGGGPSKAFEAYVSVRNKGQHIVARAGDKLPIKGIDVHVVSSAGTPIKGPLPGGGVVNPLCRDFRPKDETTDRFFGGENAQSVATIITLGRFRMANLADLTWNREHELACPNNLLGPVDVYLTTHHGQDISGPPVMVHAFRPRVAIMNNGAKKGGAIESFQTLRRSPGLEDLWQLHYAVAAGSDENSPERLIANPDESTAHYIKLTARNDGSFAITNSRNGYRKDYAPR